MAVANIGVKKKAAKRRKKQREEQRQYQAKQNPRNCQTRNPQWKQWSKKFEITYKVISIR